MFALCRPKQHGSTPKGTPLTGIGEGYRKSGFQYTKALLSLKRNKMGPRLLLRTNRSHICAFNWCKNQISTTYM